MSALKWSITIAALVLLASYAAPRAWSQLQGAVTFDAGGDDDELPAADPADSQPEVIEGDPVVATSDLASSDGTLLARMSETILLGEEGADQILIGFEPIPADPACFTSVQLEAFLVESTGNRLDVQPAALSGMVDLEDGQALPPDAIIAGSAPATAVATSGTSGWLRWEIQGPYTLAHRTASPDALVVLSIAFDAEDAGAGGSVLGTTDSIEDWAPRLKWSAVPGCSDIGVGNGVTQSDPAIEEEAADVTGQDTDA